MLIHLCYSFHVPSICCLSFSRFHFSSVFLLHSGCFSVWNTIHLPYFPYGLFTLSKMGWHLVLHEFYKNIFPSVTQYHLICLLYPFLVVVVFSLHGNAHFEKKNEFEYWASYFIFIGECFCEFQYNWFYSQELDSLASAT